MRFLLVSVLVGCAVLGGGSEGEDGIDTGDSMCSGDWTEIPSDFAEDLGPDGCQYRVAGMGNGLRLVFDAPVFAAALADGAATASYTFPDDQARLTVDQGCNLDAGWCGADGSATVVTTYTATGGTVTVSAGDDTNGDVLATVTFEGVTFENEDGTVLAMDPLTWTDVLLYGIED
jgi:hypothetical protein